METIGWAFDHDGPPAYYRRTLSFRITAKLSTSFYFPQTSQIGDWGMLGSQIAVMVFF